MEGEGFRDRAPQFDELGVRIYGISFDPVEANAEWAELMGFPFPLLSDPDRAAGAAMDVLREAGNPRAHQARRITYVVGPDGVIRKAYLVKEIKAHPAEVLDDLRSLLVG